MCRIMYSIMLGRSKREQTEENLIMGPEMVASKVEEPSH
jgi:hypothetical protein